MYKYIKKLLPKNSIELVVDIKKEFIKKEYDKAFDKLLAEPEPTEEVEVKELQRGDYIYHNPAGILCRMIEVPGIGLMAIPMDEGIIPVAYRLGPHKVLRIIRRQVESARETPPGTPSFKRGACTF